jgi:hypothetical protein
MTLYNDIIQTTRSSLASFTTISLYPLHYLIALLLQVSGAAAGLAAAQSLLPRFTDELLDAVFAPATPMWIAAAAFLSVIALTGIIIIGTVRAISTETVRLTQFYKAIAETTWQFILGATLLTLAFIATGSALLLPATLHQAWLFLGIPAQAALTAYVWIATWTWPVHIGVNRDGCLTALQNAWDDTAGRRSSLSQVFATFIGVTAVALTPAFLFDTATPIGSLFLAALTGVICLAHTALIVAIHHELTTPTPVDEDEEEPEDEETIVSDYLT